MFYIFDGTQTGFLTAFVRAFHDKDAVLSSKKTQLAIDAEPIFVNANSAIAQKAVERLLTFDQDAMHDLDILLRSGMENNEQLAFRYFHLLANVKRPIGKRLAEPDVFSAVECMRKVGWEIHKLHGFVRFMETASGALYAPISPDNDVCDLLVPHFRARLPQYSFVLHDVLRSKAAVYDGKNTFVAPLPQADVVLSANEYSWQSLWQNYYHAVNIPSRQRLKQMRGYMPIRYWKHLPEKWEKPRGFDEY